MDKPPRGKHSTKGLGKKVPQDSDFAKWRDDVTVPCGKPVPSKAKASELMYNEYIVYNTAQVTLLFPNNLPLAPFYNRISGKHYYPFHGCSCCLTRVVCNEK